MSSTRTIRLLLRAYPRAWRARYGDELEGLIADASDGRRMPWRTGADVLCAGGRERLRSAGLRDAPPHDQVRGGALLVLCAWAMFVAGGVMVQKASEHWQSALPAADRALPAAAFTALLIAAAGGGALVLAGVACAAPSLPGFVSDGGWARVRRSVITAALLTLVAAVAGVGLVAWAHGLTAPQRAGHDAAYAAAFVACALLAGTSLVAWTVAAVGVGRRLSLSTRTLEAEAWIAGGVTAAMAVMTVAAGIWWAVLAGAAPWFLNGGHAGAGGSPLAPQLVLAASMMLLATAMGVVGSQRAARAVPALSGHRRR